MLPIHFNFNYLQLSQNRQMAAHVKMTIRFSWKILQRNHDAVNSTAEQKISGLTVVTICRPSWYFLHIFQPLYAITNQARLILLASLNVHTPKITSNRYDLYGLHGCG